MRDELLDRIVTEAGRRLGEDLARDMPVAAPQIRRHLRRVPSLTNPTASLGPEAFPIFAMPYWLMPADRREADLEFLVDLSYSTLAGYYAIRLIDNVADGDGPEQLRAVLPATGYFHWRFLAPYQKHFPADHPFWAEFDRLWSEQADVTVADAMLTDVTEEQFRQISSKKFGATKIPLAAVAHRYDMDADIAAWYDLVDEIGALVQLWNDFLDWRHDSEHGIVTWVQSEARKTMVADGGLTDWFARQGFGWGKDRLTEQMLVADQCAKQVNNEDAVRWSADRRRALLHQLALGSVNPSIVGVDSLSLGDRGSTH